MRAARLEAYGEPLSLQEVPVPVVGSDGVLVRVGGAGLCHSDLHALRGRLRNLPRLPVTLGHENAGWVEAAGPDAEGVSVGDAVVVYGGWGCGTCTVCRRGAEQLCDLARWVGFGPDGGFAELLLVKHARYLVPIHDLDPAEAAPLADAALTPYRAVRRLARWVAPTDTVAVIGAGGLGQFAIQFLRLLTGVRIVAVDVDPRKLLRAEQLGAHDAVDASRGDAARSIRAAGDGAAAVLDFVGSDETLLLAADLIATGGSITLVGLAGGTLPFSFQSVAPEVRVGTSTWGTLGELADVVGLARRGDLVVDVERIPMEGINQAFDRLERGEVSGRAVLVP